MHVPTGRYEKRTARAVTVELLRLDESQPNKRAVTENVSPRGARIVTDWNRAPGKHLLVSAPKEGVKGAGARRLLPTHGEHKICCRPPACSPG
jgi:hypothetical protein